MSQDKLPLHLGFFLFVYNTRQRGKALLGALIVALVARRNRHHPETQQEPSLNVPARIDLPCLGGTDKTTSRAVNGQPHPGPFSSGISACA
jgi:hypothetical protein